MVDKGPLKVSELPQIAELPERFEEELRSCTVTLREVINKGNRLDASVYGVNGKHAREVIKQCKWPIKYITGENGISDAFYPARFKRIFVRISEYPLILPSQIREINPKPKGYLSKVCNVDFDSLTVRSGQILLTRSGTVGNCSFVGGALNGKTISDDIIRLTCREETDKGYLYAFLHTKTGRTLISSNEYGAVVPHIEPAHLSDIPIPYPPLELRKKINNLVIRSYDLRDESNRLIGEAEDLLRKELDLPLIEPLKPSYFDAALGFRNFSTKLSKLSSRLDASYHIPVIESVLNRLKGRAAELTNIGDERISKRVILPSHFKRVYVSEGQGTPLIGGRQIYELDPINKKYLALSRYSDKLKDEIVLDENMILITAKGTVGKITLVPKHWVGWVMSSNIISITVSSSDIAGYLYVFLSSAYGRELITRNVYGAVVDIIEPYHVKKIPVPLLKNEAIQREINRLALKANSKLTDAYYAEREAIRIINDMVIFQD